MLMACSKLPPGGMIPPPLEPPASMIITIMPRRAGFAGMRPHPQPTLGGYQRRAKSLDFSPPPVTIEYYPGHKPWKYVTSCRAAIQKASPWWPQQIRAAAPPDAPVKVGDQSPIIADRGQCRSQPPGVARTTAGKHPARSKSHLYPPGFGLFDCSPLSCRRHFLVAVEERAVHVHGKCSILARAAGSPGHRPSRSWSTGWAPAPPGTSSYLARRSYQGCGGRSIGACPGMGNGGRGGGMDSRSPYKRADRGNFLRKRPPTGGRW